MRTTLPIRDVIAALVVQASGGLISAAVATDPDTDLRGSGLSSLAFLQLIDSIENEFGVYVDLDGDTDFLRTVDGIAGYVEVQRGDAG